MDTPEGQVITEQKVTFFTLQPSFPDLVEGKVDTCKFLEAAKGVVELIDRMGKGFSLVKHDVLGNIEKLNKKYLTNPKKYGILTDMVLDELSDGGKVIRDALLWLKRALHFVQVFLGYFIEDFYQFNNNEEITLLLKKAYSATLRPHHGWITQKLFIVVVSICPSKNQMFSLLALGKDDVDHETIIQGMETYINNLEVNLKVLDQFCVDNNFESGKEA